MGLPKARLTPLHYLRYTINGQVGSEAPILHHVVVVWVDVRPGNYTQDTTQSPSELPDRSMSNVNPLTRIPV